MVIWWIITGIRWERQQTPRMVRKKHFSAAQEVQLTSSCSESNCLVSPQARLAGLWRRNSRQDDKVLEYSEVGAAPVHWDRQLGLQPDVFKERERTCVNAWLQLKSDQCMEIPEYEENGNLDRPLIQSAVLGSKSWWLDLGHRSRRRDSEILERIPTKKERKERSLNNLAELERHEMSRNTIRHIKISSEAMNEVILWNMES